MTEKTPRRFAFLMFVIFVPLALFGGLLKGLAITDISLVLIAVGLIGAMLGLIVLKIAGPPNMEGK